MLERRGTKDFASTAHSSVSEEYVAQRELVEFSRQCALPMGLTGQVAVKQVEQGQARAGLARCCRFGLTYSKATGDSKARAGNFRARQFEYETWLA